MDIESSFVWAHNETSGEHSKKIQNSRHNTTRKGYVDNNSVRVTMF